MHPIPVIQYQVCVPVDVYQLASLKSPVVAEYPQCVAIMNKILWFDWLIQLGLVA